MQFVDVKTDIAFKKVFGGEQHKEILIGFLNAMLDLYFTRLKLTGLKYPKIESRRSGFSPTNLKKAVRFYRVKNTKR